MNAKIYKQARQECQIKQFSKMAKDEQLLKENSLVHLSQNLEKVYSC